MTANRGTKWAQTDAPQLGFTGSFEGLVSVFNG